MFNQNFLRINFLILHLLLLKLLKLEFFNLHYNQLFKDVTTYANNIFTSVINYLI
jgi:hypothetical protein